MNTHRNGFLESFAQSSALLKLIFLNHSGAPSKLLSDISSIDLLADKKSTSDFISYCESHPLVNEIRIVPQYKKTEIILEFKDNSELRFCLIRKMIRKALSCLTIEKIRKEGYVNEFNMLVASHHHHYEYILLVCQFAGMPFPDRYRNYFSAFNFENRTQIFRYIQPRYDLVINNLEELYQPKSNTVLHIMVGLRKEKYNSLFRMFLRLIEYGLFNLTSFLLKKTIHVSPSGGQSSVVPNQNRNKTAGQAIL
jgi:hypothetical protein